MSECEIIKVDNHESDFLPKIVKFQNGQPRNTKKLQCKSFLNRKNDKTLVAVTSDRLMYLGEEDTENDLFYTLLAIRNKKTNKVRVVPVNTVSLNVHMTKTNELLDSTLNESKNIGDLYKQFGSKKNKRQTEQYEKMKMKIDKVEDELKKAVADVEINEEDLIPNKIDEANSDYKPKINRDASNVEKIYNLYSIISREELDSLKDLANTIVNKSVIDEQLTSFVLDCVNKLKQESVTDLKRYKILLYCDAILKFFKLAFKDIRKKIKLHPYPDVIVNKILNEYTIFSDNVRNRPVSMREKAVCYVIVLALIAMNYKIDLESLSTSIHVGIKKLSEISRVLGAQPLSSSCKTVIVLKLPLPPPVAVKKKVNRKK